MVLSILCVGNSSEFDNFLLVVDVGEVEWIANSKHNERDENEHV
jgi:hypothetical protein